MSTQGNIAVAGEMQKLLKLMDEIKDLPLQEQLDRIRKHISEIKSAADSDWL